MYLRFYSYEFRTTYYWMPSTKTGFWFCFSENGTKIVFSKQEKKVRQKKIAWQYPNSVKENKKIWNGFILISTVIYPLTKIERGQRIGTLPLLLMCGDFDIIHDQWHPAAKHKHSIANDGGGVKTAGKGRDPLNGRLAPWHRLYKQGTLTFTLCTYAFTMSEFVSQYTLFA